MEKREWNNSSISTSLLGFGAMRLKTINGEIDEEKALKLFDLAYNNGVNYFDTALVYTDGKNETFVGKALKRYPRDSFYLATKFSLFFVETKEEACAMIDKQLSTLQTDYIDFYLFHAMNKDLFKKVKEWDLIKVVEKWKEEKKIRHIGFSFHDDYNTFKEILDYYDWEFCQLQLNYLDFDSQQGIQGYKDLVERNIPIIVMEPLKGGKLASFNNEVEEIFKNYSDASLASWAFRWVGSLDGVKVILSGMNEESQMLDNLNTFKTFKPLNDFEQGLIVDAKNKLESLIKVGCTGCNYCMPCPKGVNIPNNFRMYNDYSMYNNIDDTQYVYNQLKKKNASFNSCVNCKMCVKKCPQKIDIPNEFNKLKKDMDFLK